MDIPKQTKIQHSNSVFCNNQLLQSSWCPILRKNKFQTNTIVLIGVSDIYYVFHVYVIYPYSNPTSTQFIETIKDLYTYKECRHALRLVDFIMISETTMVFICHERSIDFIQVGIYDTSSSLITKKVTFDIASNDCYCVSLFVFENKPALLFILGPPVEVYYELLLSPFCIDAIYEIFQYTTKIITPQNLINRAKGDIFSDDLEVIFYFTENTHRLKFENGTMVENATHYPLKYLIYTADTGPYTETFEFLGYSQFEGEGLRCAITIKVLGCYPTCGTCSGPNDIDCLTCKSNTRRYNGDNQRCFYFTPPHSYYDSELDRFDSCYSSCYNCSEKGDENEHKCDLCYYDYYHKVDAPISNCYYKPSGYYLNVNHEYQKCYPTCVECLGAGTNSNHNCKTCKESAVYNEHQCTPNCDSNECFFEGQCLSNYDHLYNDGIICYNCKEEAKYKIKDINECNDIITINEINNKGYVLLDDMYNYYEKCPYKWYIDDNNNYKCTTDNNCKDIPDRNILEESNNQCVKNCMRDIKSFCKECIGRYLYLYKGKCILQCPQYTKENRTKGICEANIDEINHCAGMHCKEVVWNIIDDIITDFNDISLTIYGEDYTLQVYQLSSKCDTQNEKTNSSYINMSQCLSFLEQEKHIEHEEDIIILKEDIFTRDKAYSSMKFSLYHKNGSKIDNSICDSVSTNISYPLNPSLNTEKAKKYASLGIDIYDSQSPFFNNICESFSEEGKDIPLTDRRQDIYKNVSFCDTHCSYQGINYTSNHVNCQCNSSTKIKTNNSIFPYIKHSIN